jgi:hypothetical protein
MAQVCLDTFTLQVRRIATPLHVGIEAGRLQPQGGGRPVRGCRAGVVQPPAARGQHSTYYKVYV